MPEGNFPIAPHPRNINAPRDQDGNTYLHELVLLHAPVEKLREAINLGADINALNKQNMPPLGLAILKGDAGQMRDLLDLGADINFATGKMSYSNTPLVFNATYLAAFTGNAEKLDIILSKGGAAFINTPSIEPTGYDDKWTALHVALKKSHYNIVDTLLDAGAFACAPGGPSGDTPMMLAIDNDSPQAIGKLVRAGVSLEEKNPATGNTPLLYAASRDKRFSLSRLLQMGADTRAVNNAGETALMFTAWWGAVRQMNEILATRVNVNARNAKQETAVMIAAARGNAEAAQALVKAGADLLLTDNFNRTASIHAAGSTNYSLRWSLEEAEKLQLQKQFETSYKKFRPGG
ncbi:MAG: ankyrin repeat domain-containing protein [Alphaproteobacteria bacterium]|nr:ankyrin repeat domain-containing protein [Alphaproteobacteria bacterium]